MGLLLLPPQKKIGEGETEEEGGWGPSSSFACPPSAYTSLYLSLLLVRHSPPPPFFHHFDASSFLFCLSSSSFAFLDVRERNQAVTFSRLPFLPVSLRAMQKQHLGLSDPLFFRCRQWGTGLCDPSGLVSNSKSSTVSITPKTSHSATQSKATTTKLCHACTQVENRLLNSNGIPAVGCDAPPRVAIISIPSEKSIFTYRKLSVYPSSSHPFPFCKTPYFSPSSFSSLLTLHISTALPLFSHRMRLFSSLLSFPSYLFLFLPRSSLSLFSHSSGGKRPESACSTPSQQAVVVQHLLRRSGRRRKEVEAPLIPYSGRAPPASLFARS